MSFIKLCLKLIVGGLVGGATLIFIFFALAYYFIGYAPYRGIDFNRTTWDQRATVEVCGMYSQIKNDILKNGMDKVEVESLLGKGKPLKHDGYPENNMAYVLGYCGSWDVTFMIIIFDDNNKISGITTYQS